jgi:hypothetical protein
MQQEGIIAASSVGGIEGGGRPFVLIIKHLTLIRV